LATWRNLGQNPAIFFSIEIWREKNYKNSKNIRQFEKTIRQKRPPFPESANLGEF
jgi:hypothetical protein